MVEILPEARRRDMLPRDCVNLPTLQRIAPPMRLLQRVNRRVTPPDDRIERLPMARRHTIAHIRRPCDVREHSVRMRLPRPQIYQHPIPPPYRRRVRFRRLEVRIRGVSVGGYHRPVRNRHPLFRKAAAYELRYLKLRRRIVNRVPDAPKRLLRNNAQRIRRRDMRPQLRHIPPLRGVLKQIRGRRHINPE